MPLSLTSRAAVLVVLATGCASLPKADRDLFAAVKADDPQSVERSLAAGATIEVRNDADCDGLSPLGCAAGWGSARSAELLIARGANVNARGRHGDTPLHVAAYHQNLPLAVSLLQHRADVNARSNPGWTPLHKAMERLALMRETETPSPDDVATTVRLVQLLLASGAAVDAPNASGVTPLHAAAMTRQTEPVRLLIDKGAAVDSKDADGVTPLYLAAKRDALEVAELLIARGAAVNARTKSGYTPLSIAAQQGNPDLVKLLLRRGADVRATDNEGRTPLVWACESLVRRYTLESATPGSSSVRHEVPTAEVARERRALREVKGEFAAAAVVLVQGGADPNVGVGERRPLRAAAIVGDKALAETLMARGAEVNPRPDSGAESPLHAAIAESHRDVAELLVGKGADVNARTALGRTPLHFAAYYMDDRSLIELLIRRGADVNAKDQDRLSPLALAVKAGHEDLARLLRQRGAKE